MLQQYRTWHEWREYIVERGYTLTNAESEQMLMDWRSATRQDTELISLLRKAYYKAKHGVESPLSEKSQKNEDDQRQISMAIECATIEINWRDAALEAIRLLQKEQDVDGAIAVLSAMLMGGDGVE